MPVSTFERKLDQVLLNAMIVVWVGIGTASGRGLQTIGRLMRPDIHFDLSAVIWVPLFAAISIAFVLYSANALKELKERTGLAMFTVSFLSSLLLFGYLFLT